MAQKLSRAEVADFVNDKESYWEAMVSAGWLMPALRQSMVTLDWMAQIRAKTAWCPKKSEVANYKQVLHSPPRHTLANILYDRVAEMCEGMEKDEATLHAMLTTAELAKKKMADADWLL